MAKAAPKKNAEETATQTKRKRKRTVSPINGNDLTKHQFKKRNPGGPGRPRSAALREKLIECLESGQGLDWWYKKLKDKAAKGDVAAIRTLFEYTISKPRQDVDVTSDDKPIGGVLIVPDNGKGRD